MTILSLAIAYIDFEGGWFCKYFQKSTQASYPNGQIGADCTFFTGDFRIPVLAKRNVMA